MAHKFSQFVLDVFLEFLSKKSIMENISNEFIYSNEHINHLLKPDTYLNSTIATELKKMKYGQRRQHKIDNIDFIFEFWDIDNNNIKTVNFIFNYMCFIIYFLNKIYSIPRNLKIFLFNYEGKKYLPKDGILKSINVNSGMTFTYSNNNADIIVYRKEEMIKVLMHELIHAFNIDGKYISSDLTIDLTNRFCLNNKINVNETYTDTFACLLNIVMFTILEDSIGIKFKSRLNTNIKNECDYMSAQARKVLLINNYDLNNNAKCQMLNNEETHGIAYYVLKAIIFRRAIIFFENNNYMLKDMDKFILLILDCISKNNWKTFGKLQLYIQKNKTSLRMSSLDIIELISLNKTI